MVDTIAFVCNYERTISWNLIAKEYKKTRTRSKIIAIVHDKKAATLIEKNNFDKVIYLNNIEPNSISSAKKSKPLIENFNFSLEKQKDRLYRYKSMRSFQIDIENASDLLYKTFSDSSVIFFGEISWALEQLIFEFSILEKHLYFTPVALRYIDRRWGLAQGNTERTLLKNHNSTHKKDIELNNLDKKPEYFTTGMNALSLKNRILDLRNRNFQIINKGLFGKKLIYLLFNPLLNVLKKKQLSDSLKNQTLYYYGFQVQPEASIDYLSPKNRNQYKLCYEILNNLNNNEILILKGHPGERVIHNLWLELSLIFHKKVFYLSSNVESSSFVDHISGAITVTGTLGGELAQLNIPTVSLEPMFYNNLRYSTYYCNIEQALEFLRSNKPLEGLTNSQFRDYLFEHSFEGYSYHTKKYNFKDPLYIRSFVEHLLGITKCS